jgi:hypothetical protein
MLYAEHNIIVVITLNVFGDFEKWNLSKMYWNRICDIICRIVIQIPLLPCWKLSPLVEQNESNKHLSLWQDVNEYLLSQGLEVCYKNMTQKFPVSCVWRMSQLVAAY